MYYFYIHNPCLIISCLSTGASYLMESKWIQWIWWSSAYKQSSMNFAMMYGLCPVSFSFENRIDIRYWYLLSISSCVHRMPFEELQKHIKFCSLSVLHSSILRLALRLNLNARWVIYCFHFFISFLSTINRPSMFYDSRALWVAFPNVPIHMGWTGECLFSCDTLNWIKTNKLMTNEKCERK